MCAPAEGSVARSSNDPASEETIPRIPAGHPSHIRISGKLGSLPKDMFDDFAILFRFERAGSVDQDAAGGQGRQSIGEDISLLAANPHFSSIPENGVGGARGMGFHGLEAASPLGGAAVGQKRPGMLSATLAEAFFVCFWANLDCRPCRALCASSIT